MTTGNPNLKPPGSDYEQFLYTVSHDLQEPLRMIGSFLKLLETKSKDCLCDDSQQYLQMGLENAEKMKGMIHALVDLSRVNRATDPEEVMELSEVLSNMQTMYQVEFDRHQATMHVEADLKVKMIPRQLITLFQKLIENAFQNSPQSGLQIYVIAKEVNGKAELRFSDNGRGIKELYADKVFEIFKKTDAPSERLGTGLSIVREIVKRYGGDIRVESVFGKGSTFIFSLPIAAE